MNTKIIKFLVLLIMSLCFLAREGYAEQLKIYTLSSSKITELIEQTAGKRRVVMFYTSWCPYCRKAMPDLMKLEKESPGSIIAISCDSSVDDLSKYMKSFKSVPFNIVMSKEKGCKGALSQSLKAFDVKPITGFPTYLMMNKENKAVFGQGNWDLAELKKFLNGEYD